MPIIYIGKEWSAKNAICAGELAKYKLPIGQSSRIYSGTLNLVLDNCSPSQENGARAAMTKLTAQNAMARGGYNYALRL